MDIRVLVVIAFGSEDIETVTPINVFRRAGAVVVVAAVGESKNVELR
jgi:putative intracellular protease/amidase